MVSDPALAFGSGLLAFSLTSQEHKGLSACSKLEAPVLLLSSKPSESQRPAGGPYFIGGDFFPFKSLK